MTVPTSSRPAKKSPTEKPKPTDILIVLGTLQRCFPFSLEEIEEGNGGSK
jgi:hypothetical protein